MPRPIGRGNFWQCGGLDCRAPASTSGAAVSMIARPLRSRSDIIQPMPPIRMKKSALRGCRSGNTHVSVVCQSKTIRKPYRPSRCICACECGAGKFGNYVLKRTVARRGSTKLGFAWSLPRAKHPQAAPAFTPIKPHRPGPSSGTSLLPGVVAFDFGSDAICGAEHNLTTNSCGRMRGIATPRVVSAPRGNRIRVELLTCFIDGLNYDRRC
ncbi:hypothetical protein ABIF97_008526 [Bradyrhizobium japonicum]